MFWLVSENKVDRLTLLRSKVGAVMGTPLPVERVVNLKVRVLVCRCGHQWQPRGKGRPKVCPKCKRTDWDAR